MNLEEIRLSGFKSFARPISLRLSEGITSIVGPNGSGKSNIVDAILWLFGEQSLKNIRANERSDVLFAGSDGLSASSTACVTLSFRKKDASIIEVTRELTRDGKNTYIINDEKVRLKDIKELFAGTGAGKELYSIVGQGRIDKILNSSPEEIRLLIEEAAGIAIYKQRKKETLSRLTVTEENITRLQDILDELDKQKKSLYLKAKRAEKYQEYSKDLKVHQLSLFSNIQSEINSARLSLDRQNDQDHEKMKEIQKTLIQVESRWNQLREAFSQVDHEAQCFTGILEEHKQRQNHLNELREIFQAKLSDRETAFVETTTRLDQMEQNRHKSVQRKEEVSRIYKTLMDDLQMVTHKLEELEEQKESILGDYSEDQQKMMELQDVLNRNEKETGKLDNEDQRLKDMMEDHEKRLTVLQSQIESKSHRLDGMNQELNELREHSVLGSQEEEITLQMLQEVRTKVHDIEQSLRALENQRYEMMQNLKHLEAEKAVIDRQIREFTGFNRPVKALFQAKENDPLLRNMIDIVANILEVDPQYEIALEVILGARSQNIVTVDTDTAKHAVQILKENHLGRATFLPLDTLDYRPVVVNTALQKHPGFVGYATDLVKVGEEFSILPTFLFGDTVVVKTLEDGLELRKTKGLKNPMVSLDGQMIASRGAITGGSYQVDSRTSLLARNRRLQEVSEEIETLQNQMDQAQRKEKKMIQEKNEATQLRNHLEGQLNEIMMKNASIKRTVQELTSAIAELEKETDQLESLRIDYMAKMEGAQARREQIAARMAEIQTESHQIETEFFQSSEIIKEQKQRIAELQSEIDGVRLNQNTLQERERQYNQEIKDIQSDLEGSIEDTDVLKIRKKELEHEIGEQREKIQELNTELQSLKKEMETLFASLKDQQQDRQQKTQQIHDLEKELTGLKEQREEVREKSHQADLQNQQLEFRYQTLHDRMRHAGITEDELFDRIDELDHVNQLEEIVRDLEKKIKYLGNVDLTAIDEYNDVDHRHTDMSNQQVDLLTAKKSLEELLEKTDHEAKEIFLKTLQQINENFNEMIGTLFGGGTGELRLIPHEDILETGIEIVVRRPGKKLQKMYLLSGGEKSLVGIALVFAMLRINPSPFYILDEVDAALDDFNAERLKLLVEKYKGIAQFIVITHNKLVMEVADRMYGITQSHGVSMVMSVELEQYAV